MPATDTRHRTTWGTRFRFLVRAAGLTGVLAAAVGAALFASAFPSPARWNADTLKAAAGGAHGDFARAAAWTLAGGVVAAAAALAVELLGGLLLVAGRRTAANTAATVGVVAAAALLVFVNAYSFTRHARYDLTRGRQFTLPPGLADRLRTLRPESPTTIVVLQMHRTFGTSADQRDSYTSGAERKVTEKVKDLVDLFREFGPRFRVEVLDTEAFGYDRQLADLTAGAPELRAAIEGAPENSILFHANGRVQRLAFNEFLQLDREASREAGGGRGNLVLLPQGVETFARRVLAVQERRPRAAVCVVHPVLGTDAEGGRAGISTVGLKKTLTTHGFEVVDVVLRQNWENDKELEPSALTAGESRLERAEAERDAAEDAARVARAERQVLDVVLKDLDTAARAGLSEQAAFYAKLRAAAPEAGWLEVAGALRQLAAAGRRLTAETEGEFRSAARAALGREQERADEVVRKAAGELAAAEARLAAVVADERAVEGRRNTDLKAKFGALLADVDLLVVPRITLVNATTPERIAGMRVHALSKEQAEVVKEFMKAGKPVLACLGSVSGTNGPEPGAADDFERLLADRGIELGSDTVLFDTEAQVFANRGAAVRLGAAGGVEVPPVAVADGPAEGKDPNPIARALRVAGRGAAGAAPELRFRALRPVYLAPGWQDRLGFAAEFVRTAPDAWNEARPFLLADREGNIAYRPRYDRTPQGDPKFGTRAAERRGPFPVGVAVEGKVPASWFDDGYGRGQFAAGLLAPVDGVLAAALTAAAAKQERPTGRLVVFGSGNLFAGPKLEPAQERLLLHSANWLTGREDRLPRADLPAWQFPRVEMSERDANLWRFGTAVGLPLAAVYVGLMATMLRRLR